MVQETQPSVDVLFPLLLLYGRRNYLWLRLATHQHSPILKAIQHMYVYLRRMV